MPRPIVQSGLPASDPLARGYFANATLTAINGPGAPDAYGDTTDGSELWTGEARGYLTRIARTVVSSGEQLFIKQDIFALPRTESAPILEAAGPDWTATSITIEDRRDPAGAVTRTFRVKAMEDRAAGTILDHIRLELEGG